MKLFFIKSGFIIISVLLYIHVNGQNLCINEFVSSNSSGLQSTNGDYNDWIEIYNTTNQAVNLSDYYLSDDDQEVQKWKLPDLDIKAHGYVVIFASGNDTIMDEEIHGNFQISQSGETLVLSDKNNEIINQIQPIALPSNNAYARINDDNRLFSISNTPTPGQSNVLNHTIHCSHPSGYYDNSILLSISHASDDCILRYTMDGSLPSIKSSAYENPIRINDNRIKSATISHVPTTPLEGEDQLYEYVWKSPKAIYCANVIRYALFKDGKQVSKIYTQSYFIEPGMDAKYTFPIISLVSDNQNLFQNDTGIYIPGKRFDDNGFNWFPEGNYNNRGSAWERDVHISYFEPTGKLAFESDARVRMRGYGSVCFPQKSLNIYFKNNYGIGNISYPIFENGIADKHKRLILRSSGNDFLHTHFRDAMLQKIIEPMDLEVQDFTPSVVFINGEYWGIHNIREKYDKSYFKHKYNIDENELNLLTYKGEVEEGDSTEYMDLLSFVENNDLSKKESYEHVKDRIDIDNYIDFQIVEIYTANYDWPCNNYKVWKSNDKDSKWRFLIYDLDYSFGFNYFTPYNTQSMEHATKDANSWPHCSESNVLFRQLLNNEEFKNQFIKRFSFCIRNIFQSEKVLQYINDFETLFAPEMDEHIARWNYPISIEDWRYKVEILREFARERPDAMNDNLIDYFGIDPSILIGITKQNHSTYLLLTYPNPNNGNCYLFNNSSQSIQSACIQIFNSYGQAVFSEQNISLNPREQIKLNLNHLSKGVYNLVLTSTNTNEIQSIVITD